MAYIVAEHGVSERQACKLLELDRSSYRYQPQPDQNVKRREELVALARQKPRFGYRRLGALLEKRGHRFNHKRIYRLYREEHLAVRRLKRKRLVRPGLPVATLSRMNQEWSTLLPGQGNSDAIPLPQTPIPARRVARTAVIIAGDSQLNLAGKTGAGQHRLNPQSRRCRVAVTSNVRH